MALEIQDAVKNSPLDINAQALFDMTAKSLAKKIDAKDIDKDKKSDAIVLTELEANKSKVDVKKTGLFERMETAKSNLINKITELKERLLKGRAIDKEKKEDTGKTVDVAIVEKQNELKKVEQNNKLGSAISNAKDFATLNAISASAYDKVSDADTQIQTRRVALVEEVIKTVSSKPESEGLWKDASLVIENNTIVLKMAGEPLKKTRNIDNTFALTADQIIAQADTYIQNNTDEATAARDKKEAANAGLSVEGLALKKGIDILSSPKQFLGLINIGDYQDLFRAVLATKNENKIKMANTFMQVINSGKGRENYTDDGSQASGKGTFKKQCNVFLGEGNAVYKATEERINRQQAERKQQAEAEQEKQEQKANKETKKSAEISQEITKATNYLDDVSKYIGRNDIALTRRSESSIIACKRRISEIKDSDPGGYELYTNIIHEYNAKLAISKGNYDKAITEVKSVSNIQQQQKNLLETCYEKNLENALNGFDFNGVGQGDINSKNSFISAIKSSGMETGFSLTSSNINKMITYLKNFTVDGKRSSSGGAIINGTSASYGKEYWSGADEQNPNDKKTINLLTAWMKDGGKSSPKRNIAETPEQVTKKIDDAFAKAGLNKNDAVNKKVYENSVAHYNTLKNYKIIPASFSGGIAEGKQTSVSYLQGQDIKSYTISNADQDNTTKYRTLQALKSVKRDYSA